MRKRNSKIGIVVGAGSCENCCAFSEGPPVDSMSTVNFEALPLLSSNLTYSNSVIDRRGESETGKRCSAVELYFEHQKNIVNAKIDQRIITNITSMG